MSLATFVGTGVSLRVRDSVKTSTTCRQCSIQVILDNFVKSTHRPTRTRMDFMYICFLKLYIYSLFLQVNAHLVNRRMWKHSCWTITSVKVELT